VTFRLGSLTIDFFQNFQKIFPLPIFKEMYENDHHLILGSLGSCVAKPEVGVCLWGKSQMIYPLHSVDLEKRVKERGCD